VDYDEPQRVADTALALGPGTWRDVLTDREIRGGAQPLAALWRDLPIALYLRVAR